MRFAPHALVTASVLALAACAVSGVSTVGQKYPMYRTADSKHATNGHDVFVVVQGGGYGVDQNAFRQAVLDTMQRNRGEMNARFTAAPQANYNSEYKVVMLFNGPVNAQADALCRQPASYGNTPAPTAMNETRVLATFCRFDAPLTEVNGRAAGVTSVSDARFASLVQQTMTDLFPLTDERPNRDSDKGGSAIP